MFGDEFGFGAAVVPRIVSQAPVSRDLVVRAALDTAWRVELPACIVASRTSSPSTSTLPPSFHVGGAWYDEGAGLRKDSGISTGVCSAAGGSLFDSSAAVGASPILRPAGLGFRVGETSKFHCSSLIPACQRAILVVPLPCSQRFC
eukprot:CAMPEP_0114134608 /NCGR_PEP_ID=MMETSP0043_2-20121206/14263_1 /TAXON_ID=464988 /ORGANISM="Hemiselmis andersenii, Strain CCMP644" /LENGTH=145 /DNA_ID=CAMNT_0001228289 /DNA_START=449 /DNA_END=883 /DNA_ORIENTATION=+